MDLKACFDKGISFLTTPAEAFEKEKTTGFNEAFKHILVLGLITSVLGAVIAAAMTSFGMSFATGLPAEALLFTSPPLIFVFALISGYIGLIIGAFIWGLWLHLWAYVLGAKNGLEQTIKAVFYGGTPIYLLGWIPLINVLAGIWFFILSGMGLVRLHGITGGKAALAIIIALVIPVVIIGALLVTLLATILAAIGMSPGMMSFY